MSGWISLHRQIQNHWLWENNEPYSKLEAWLYLLLNANHKTGKSVRENSIIEVERGQILTSKKQLCEIFKWSNSKLNNFLKLLEKDEMLHIKSTSKYTLLTIVNYDFFQSNDNEKHFKNTSEAHQKHIKSTSETYQKHTNNKGNNVNNENNDNNNTGGGGVFEKSQREKDFAEIVNEWQKLGFGMITERSTEQILDWLKIHSKDLIMHVIQYAHDNGAINQRYVYKVLKNAKEKNIKTVDDFEAAQIKRTQEKRSYTTNKKDVIVPKWFKEQKEEQDPPQKTTTTDAEIAAKIAKFRSN